VTIEDRLRATTEAVTASMHPVRPLDLHPDKAGTRQPAGRRRARPPRGRPGWLVPLAAAVAVVAVAATLAVVRGLSGPDSGSHPAPSATSTSITPTSAGVPPYYVEINDVGGPVIPGVPKGAVVIGDTSTGKRLRIFMPAQGTAFRTVAGSSDGRTFVLLAAPTTSDSPIAKAQDTWDVIRLTPGISRLVPVTRPLTTVSMAGKNLEGVAVSPDGSTLAILYQATKSGGGILLDPSGPATLQTYSLSTGRLLRTWTAPAADSTIDNFADLTWLDNGETLAFVYPNMSAHRTVLILNTARPGTSLISESRTAFTVPTGHTCDATLLMTADGKSVICGNFAPNNGWCTTGQLAFTAYSVATGKLDRVLYSYQGGCHFGTATVIWAKSAALAIGWIAVSKPVTPYPPIANEVGVLSPGNFTSLPGLKVGTGEENPSMIAF